MAQKFQYRCIDLNLVTLVRSTASERDISKNVPQSGFYAVDHLKFVRFDPQTGHDPTGQAGRGWQFRDLTQPKITGEIANIGFGDICLNIGVPHGKVPGGLESWTEIAQVIEICARKYRL